MEEGKEGEEGCTKGEAELGVEAAETGAEGRGRETGGREVGTGVEKWEGSDHLRDHEVGRGK